MSEILIDVQNMSFSHENGRCIFMDVSLSIPKGKVTAIMGPSGTGKTTLLRLMGGQLKPTQGRITVEGECVHEISLAKLYALRKRMGMLFQASGLFTHLSVFENVAFPLREHTLMSESMIRSIVLLKLQMVGLRGAAFLMPAELSGGMARRVALARAIAFDPALIMYDEPFTGQDPISMGVLVKLIRTLNDALHLTTVIVSHDVQEALSIADYAYVISNNRVMAHGTPQEIIHHPSTAVQQFIQGLPDGSVPFHYPAPSLASDFLEQGKAT